MRYSSFKAADLVIDSDHQMSTTGLRDRVYFRPGPAVVAAHPAVQIARDAAVQAPIAASQQVHL